ncbi:MAG: hypothetical protein EPN25_09380 [Nitrospirae bacterium]|nr:MAG: hypothetical protein EPN25_09380 [Nitrospirota bacterium]
MGKSAPAGYCAEPAAAAGLFLLLTLGLYYPVPVNFWLIDDTQFLKHAILYRPWESFFSPVAWQRLGGVNFNPWLSFSYHIDWSLFGLRPGGFYLHHLLSLALLDIAAYLTLRLWLRPGLSFISVLAFTLSPVFAELSQTLMCRHYIEGMIFSCISIYAMVWGTRRGSRPAQLLSALFYLLACLAKEVYVPLPFFFLLLPEGRLRERLTACLPAFAMTVLYFFWRWYMLGKIGGGYGATLSWPLDGLLFFPHLLSATGAGLAIKAHPWWPAAVAVSVLAASCLLLWLDKKSFGRALLALPLIALPIVPVSTGMTGRYVFLPLFCLIVLHAVAWEGLLKRSAANFTKTVSKPVARLVVLLWAVVVVAALSFAAITHYRLFGASVAGQAAEGSFVLQEGSAGDLLLKPMSLPHYYEGLAWLRNRVLRLPPGPSVLYDEAIYCSDAAGGPKFSRVWQYDETEKRLMPRQAQEHLCRTCGPELLSLVRAGVPLTIDFRCSGNVCLYEFGPRKDGSYTVLAGEPAGIAYQMPARGRAVLEDMKVPWRLRYTSPEGWSAYSPVLTLTIAQGKGSVSWKGDSIPLQKADYCAGGR